MIAQPSAARVLRSVLHASALAIAVTSASRVVAAQDWAARFPPHPDCKLAIRHGSLQSPPDSASTGATLVVRPVQFGADEPVLYAEVVLTALHQVGAPPASRGANTRMAPVQVFAGMTPGQYTLMVRALGYRRRADTVTIEPRALDTVRVALENSGDRTNHNCRPRGFRRPGESACVAEGLEAELELDYARTFAEPERRRAFKLPAIDSSRIALVRDEDVCEQAGHAYGQPGDPPRRVIVVAMDHLYLVYDPFEPEAVGEWDSHCIYDRSWRPVLCLAD